MRADPDSIAAIATPAGAGGLGVLRVSGPAVTAIARALLGFMPQPRYAHYAAFLDGDGAPIERGLALYFAAPASYTGEDVIELHAHGSPVVLDLLLRRVLELGARRARPGEFTERAFLNGKLDLAQAEAVADLITARSESAARAAQRALAGAFSQRVHTLVAALTALRVQVEAAIDFADEELELLGDPALAAGLAFVRGEIATLLADTRRGVRLARGARAVLIGRPNTGKSSLLNALAQNDSAIVSALPGTTRDLLREQIQIDGLPLHIIDTAGLRDTQDPVEHEGMRRARAALAQADHALVLFDAPSQIPDLVAEVPPAMSYTLVRNKIDLEPTAPAMRTTPQGAAIALSAKTGAGLDLLRQHLKACMGYQAAGEGAFIARRRHLDAMQRAQAHVQAGVAQLQQARAGELLAEELRQAQQALSEITGTYTSDDLLGSIFSSFCIGK